MRISLDALTTQVTALAGLEGVEPRALSGDEAMDWARALGATRQALDALLSAVTGRIAELSTGEDRTTRFARAKGFPDAGALVSEVAQVPRSDAGRLMTLGEAMSDADAGSGGRLTVGAVDTAPVQPDAAPALYTYLTSALSQGLSAEKAAIIRLTLEKMSGATAEIERSLVERAKGRSVQRVRVMCRVEWERVDHDGYLNHLRSLRSKAYVKFWDTDEGMIGIHGELDPVRGIALRQWVHDQTRDAMRTERDVDPEERRSPGELAANVLTDLAQHRLGCQDAPKSAHTTVVITAPAQAVVKGEGAAYCDGYAGPICLEMLSHIAFELEVAPALTGDAGMALFLGRATRFFTPAQKRAIALRDQGCAKCGAPVAHCDVHHIQFWSQGGPTDIDNGVLLCSGCHHRLHDFTWQIEIIDGEVWFIPPAPVDPRRRRQPACATRSPIPVG
jgi:5-methylcytosine-specific restriction protein A